MKPAKNNDIQNQYTELKEIDNLHSKYIVSVLGFNIDKNDEESRIRIFMEYCDEGDLESAINKRISKEKRVCSDGKVYFLGVF